MRAYLILLVLLASSATATSMADWADGSYESDRGNREPAVEGPARVEQNDDRAELGEGASEKIHEDREMSDSANPENP